MEQSMPLNNLIFKIPLFLGVLHKIEINLDSFSCNNMSFNFDRRIRLYLINYII